MTDYHAIGFAPGRCEGCLTGCQDCDPQPESCCEFSDIVERGTGSPFAIMNGAG